MPDLFWRGHEGARIQMQQRMIRGLYTPESRSYEVEIDHTYSPPIIESMTFQDYTQLSLPTHILENVESKTQNFVPTTPEMREVTAAGNLTIKPSTKVDEIVFECSFMSAVIDDSESGMLTLSFDMFIQQQVDVMQTAYNLTLMEFQIDTSSIYAQAVRPVTNYLQFKDSIYAKAILTGVRNAVHTYRPPTVVIRVRVIGSTDTIPLLFIATLTYMANRASGNLFVEVPTTSALEDIRYLFS